MVSKTRRGLRIYSFLLGIVLVGIGLAACSGITGDRPSDVLDKDEMISMLVDFHLAEAKVRMLDDSAEIKRFADTAYLRSHFASVFVAHNTTPGHFDQSLNYYLTHIEDLQEIYTQVIQKLTAIEAKEGGPSEEPLRNRKIIQANPVSGDSIVKNK